MKATVGKKLLAGFLSVLILMGAVGGIAVFRMKQMQEQAYEIQTVWIPNADLLARMESRIINTERLALKYVLESNSDSRQQLEEQITTMLADLQTSGESYQILGSQDEEQTLLDQMLQIQSEMKTLLEKLFSYDEQGNEEGISQTAEDLQTYIGGMLNNFQQLSQINDQLREEALNNSEKLSVSAVLLVLVLSLLGLVIGTSVAIIISRQISNPIKAMVSAARRIADGELTAPPLKVKNRDEIGGLADAFNQMAANLRSLITEMNTGAEYVATAAEGLTAGSDHIRMNAEHIAATTEELTRGSQKQAQSLEENAKSFGEMSDSVQHIAVNAETVAGAAFHTAELAGTGNQRVQAAINQMQSVGSTVSNLAQAVGSLGARSQKVGDIVDVITGIAKQTNLLALNAAIEAARVGESGKGFAVVAQEVRKLAEQSASSADEIALLIGAMQGETGQVVELMNQGEKEVAEGISAVKLASDSFQEIQQSVGQVASQIQEVSAASEQMSAGTEQVAHSMTVISDIATNTSSGTERVAEAAGDQLGSIQEISASAQSLSQMADKLRHLIGKFKV
ncbi:methyl-accepting chemotaxis protein [Paenibacillus sp. CAU 1782]